MATLKVTKENKLQMMKKYHFARRYNSSSIIAVPKSKRKRLIEKQSYLTQKTPGGKENSFVITKVFKRIPTGTYPIMT